MSKIVKKQVKIEGMHCSSCAMNIDFDLEDLDGIELSKTNYVRQETEVEFDEDKITIKEILVQIEKSGYKPSLDDQS
jgi:copper chaperone CopZ